MKKRLTTTFAAVALLALSSLFITPSANAINCRALNQGTGNAAHVAGANGAGLYKIAYACGHIGG